MQANWKRTEHAAARETIIGLFTAHSHVTEPDLMRGAGLTPRAFEQAVIDLLQEGRLRRHEHGVGSPTFTLPTLADDSLERALDSLSYEARTVHAYLRSAPNTARQITSTLQMRSVDVHHVLNELERLGLVVVRYVGQLNIYRAC